MIAYVLLGILGIFLLAKLYFLHVNKYCTNKVCLVGKTAIVTGANAGIGFETALEFAKRGAKVILACRDEKRANEAKEKIIDLTNNENVHVKLINMVSLKSVRSFVDDILNSEEKIDILVNNAGVGGLKHKMTEDGLQILMQINYFSSWLLTYLLLDSIKKSTNGRIINVSSILASRARLNLDNLNEYVGNGGYSNTKLCNILFTKELAKRLKDTNVTVYSLHPGAVKTDIFKGMTAIQSLIFQFVSFYFKTPEQGAQTTIYLGTQKNIEKHSGKHFEECAVVDDYRTAKKEELPSKLWQKTVEILEIKTKSQ